MNTLPESDTAELDPSNSVSLFYQRTLEGTLALSRWIANDPETAWDDAHEGYQLLLTRFGLLLPGDTEQIDELMVQTKRAAARCANRRYRARKRFVPLKAALEVEDLAPLQSCLFDRRMTAHCVAAILYALEPCEADLLRLCFWEEKTQAEIAQILGVTQATVSRRFAKALRSCVNVARELRISR